MRLQSLTTDPKSRVFQVVFFFIVPLPENGNSLPGIGVFKGLKLQRLWSFLACVNFAKLSNLSTFWT